MQYEQAAYIYSEITAPGITSQQRTDLQEAAWYIMNPNYANGNSSYGPDSQAMNLVTDAELHYNSINPSNYMIVSAEGSPRQQEFMIPVTTPEPGSVALFGSTVLIAGAVRAFSKKRAR